MKIRLTASPGNMPNTFTLCPIWQRILAFGIRNLKVEFCTGDIFSQAVWGYIFYMSLNLAKYSSASIETEIPLTYFNPILDIALQSSIMITPGDYWLNSTYSEMMKGEPFGPSSVGPFESPEPVARHHEVLV